MRCYLSRTPWPGCSPCLLECLRALSCPSHGLQLIARFIRNPRTTNGHGNPVQLFDQSYTLVLIELGNGEAFAACIECLLPCSIKHPRSANRSIPSHDPPMPHGRQFSAVTMSPHQLLKTNGNLPGWPRVCGPGHIGDRPPVWRSLHCSVLARGGQRSLFDRLSQAITELTVSG